MFEKKAESTSAASEDNRHFVTATEQTGVWPDGRWSGETGREDRTAGNAMPRYKVPCHAQLDAGVLLASKCEAPFVPAPAGFFAVFRSWRELRFQVIMGFKQKPPAKPASFVQVLQERE